MSNNYPDAEDRAAIAEARAAGAFLSWEQAKAIAAYDGKPVNYRCIAAPCTLPALSLQVPLCRAHWERVSRPTQTRVLAAAVNWRAIMPYKRQRVRPDVVTLKDRRDRIQELRAAVLQAVTEAVDSGRI